jgi:pantoate--beta-alanine ligase
MVTVEKNAILREMISASRKAGKRIGFVPTMGYFHEGHLSLMRRAKQENDLVVVSLFVNPAQFGPKEDYQSYPRDLKRDQSMAAEAGTDLMFVPEVTEMYPPGFETFVEVTKVSQGLCGASRPGHFRGVATVVIKLFNIVDPDRAYFGEKDAQQLRVIRRMATDLNLKLEIVGCPIVRESDGLAMSSRNVYLSPEERRAALVLYQALCKAGKMIDGGVRGVKEIRAEMVGLIDREPLAQLDYLEILDSAGLVPLDKIAGEVLIALAVKFGKTRLIDNMVFEMPEKG